MVHRDGDLHRTVHMWVVRKREDGGIDVLLQKRSKDKDSYPGCYDISSAGHVQAGDEFENAALRELEEELGIKALREDLRFIGISVLGPKDSPNTDGLDPESCKNVEIVGVYFSVGDDCIAIKSGKIYMGSKYKTPSENLTIRQCCMRDGHGSITIGSEMAGGVKNLNVENCLFLHTDRGLRIKTRRGRGKDAIVTGIRFENIIMDHVMTPVVINSFYYCDADGHSDYVQSKEFHPVDERTPYLGDFLFKNLTAVNCHAAASYLYGLPEQKIHHVVFENAAFSFAENPTAGIPAMMDGVEEQTNTGIFAKNIEKLELKNVTVQGQYGDAVISDGIDEFVR